jgi:cephalosporin hydroxylase
MTKTMISKIKLYIHHIIKRIRFFIVEIKALTVSNNLTKLAIIYNVDKWGRHSYTPHYQKHFLPYKNRKINLFEIGVGGYKDPIKGGNSLRMWKKFFPFAKIHSLDIFDKSKLQEKRIKIYKGSQTDKELLINIVREIGELHLVIDDGSHQNRDVKETFKILFPLLSVNGIYVIEDTETSYRDEYGGDSKNLSNPITTMNFLKSLADLLNYQEFRNTSEVIPDYAKEIGSIHFYHNLVFIYKTALIEQSSNFLNK